MLVLEDQVEEENIMEEGVRVLPVKEIMEVVAPILHQVIGISVMAAVVEQVLLEFIMVLAVAAVVVAEQHHHTQALQ